jgi:hypothetical protein
MSILPAALFDLDFFEPLPIQIEVSDAPLTSDAGLLPLRQFDERIGLTKQFAAVLDDPRDPNLIDHNFPEMVRSRIFGILAGYFGPERPRHASHGSRAQTDRQSFARRRGPRQSAHAVPL